MKKLFILTILNLMSIMANASVVNYQFKCSNHSEDIFAKVLIENYTTQQGMITEFHQKGDLMLYSTDGKLIYQSSLELSSDHMGLRCGYQQSLEGYDSNGNEFIHYTDYFTQNCDTLTGGTPVRSSTILKLLDYPDCKAFK